MEGEALRGAGGAVRVELSMSRRYQKREEKPVRTDRLPPHSVEAEGALLGCVLLNPKEVMSELAAATRCQVEMFYDLRHQVIWRTMLDLWQEQVPVDVVSLGNRLRDRGQEGPERALLDYLSTLPDQTPSAGNAGYYLEEVRDKFRLRSMLQVLVDGGQKILEEPEVVGPTLDGIEAAVLAVNQVRAESAARSMRELTLDSVTLLENMHRGVGIIGGIRTRFGYFDKMTGGLHRKELSVIAARPSVGKTSLAMNMGVNIAKFEHVPVGVFSMEMAGADLNLRVLCAQAGVDFHKVRTGFPGAADLELLAGATKKVAGLPIYIDDTPSLGILELRARARRMAAKYGCEVFLVDYIQLMHGVEEFSDNREREVAQVSGGLKAMAKELNAAVLALAQLNREMERQKNRKPQLADLRESGAIEQDADLVGMLYRPKTEEDEAEDAPVIPVNMLVAKQRNGPTGDVELSFRRAQMQFFDRYENRGVRPEETEGKGLSAKEAAEIAGVKPQDLF